MKGKILTLLFALPFFGVGVWMAYSVGHNLADAWQMRDWEPVQATLINAGYETHSGDESDTYEAFASYTYDFAGQGYRSARVSVAGSSDNIGDYQQDLGRRLRSTMNRGESVTAFVDPADPSNAVIDRSIRWGLLGFKSIFLFVFGGFGLALIVFTLRTPAEQDLTAEEFVSEPWLANASWQTTEITSTSKGAMYFTWFFAGIWNLISAPLPFVVYREVTVQGNMPALLGLLFPFVGIGLLVWAVRRTLEWNRFGMAPVTLDPFPGSIGGHVGGTIDINLPYDPQHKFSLSLTSIQSYVSGSGKNRSRRESAVWQDTQVAHCTSGSKGSRLTFRFDMPENLQESDAEQSEEKYHLWRLNVKASLPGVDLDRDYEIPVYATGKESLRLSNFSINQAKAEQREIDNAAIEKLFEFERGVSGTKLLFPMGRNLLGGFGGLIFGLIFSAVGWFLISREDQLFIGGIFGLCGLLVATSAFYYVLNSLEVEKITGEIRTIRRVLGFPVKRRRMRVSEFVRFRNKATMKSQSGGKHIVHYSVSAVDSNGQSIIVGEGFRGVNEADTAADFIAREFGLVSRRSDTQAFERPVEEYDILATD